MDEASRRGSMGPPAAKPQPMSIDTMLATGPNSPMRPPPTERLPGSPTTRTSYESIHTSTHKLPSRSRAASLAEVAREGKRLSLNFPIQPPNGHPSRPPSWANSPLVSPEIIASPTTTTATTATTTTTEGGFLTVLAAQERRVLELKEELRQAEQELDKLKKHYMSQEGTRKRSEVRRVQQLQPLSATIPTLDTTEEDVDGSSQWLQKEMERRKAIMSGVKTSNRKVFSGSRHTRTLSLLSPVKTNFSPQSPYTPSTRRSEDRPSRSSLTRSSTTSDIASAVASTHEDTIPQFDGAALPKDQLLSTAKQMGADIREGLLTFFEDIRQATVGEEAIHGSGPTRTSSIRQGRPGNINTRTGRPGHIRSMTASATRRDGRHDTYIDTGGSFWREHGLETPQKTNKRAKAPKHTRAQTSSPLKGTDSDEAWDIWGTPINAITSPPISNSGSSLDSDRPDTPSDAHSTPLTSAGGRNSPAPSIERTLTSHGFGTRAPVSGDGKRDAIPWPALVKLSPGNLKRTASHLMNEWEKSLSTAPHAEHDSDRHDSDSGLDYGALSPPMPEPRRLDKLKKAD